MGGQGEDRVAALLARIAAPPMQPAIRPAVILAVLAAPTACGSSGDAAQWETRAGNYCREVAAAREQALQELTALRASAGGLEASLHLGLAGTTAEHLSPLVASVGTTCFSVGETLGRAEGQARGLRLAGEEVQRTAPHEQAARTWVVAEAGPAWADLFRGACDLDATRVLDGDGVAVLRAAQEQARRAAEAAVQERARVERDFGAVLDTCAAAGLGSAGT